MNEYGQQVMRHWQTWLPSRYQQLENPQEFFTSAGQQIEQEIVRMSEEQEAAQRESLNEMDYLARVGRMNAIRSSARELAMAEWLLAPPEPETPQPEVEMLPPWMDSEGMPTDLSHPLWEMERDENVTVEQFVAACKAWEASERQKERTQ